MLELLGKAYLIDTVVLAAKKANEAAAYRFYVTDTLKIIGENTAKLSGGRYLEKRYAEIIQPQPEETRTPGEVIEKMKRMFKE